MDEALVLNAVAKTHPTHHRWPAKDDRARPHPPGDENETRNSYKNTQCTWQARREDGGALQMVRSGQVNLILEPRERSQGASHNASLLRT